MMIAARKTGDMVLFAEVVNAGTITGGSRKLGLERSTVSRRITSLEARLGISLLERSTRRLRLTAAGRLYYLHCMRVVEAAEDAEAAARGNEVQPSGKLTIAAVIPEADSLLSDLVTEFKMRHPALSIELELLDSDKDPTAFATDLTLFAGESNEASASRVEVGSVREFLWSAPKFLRASGLNGSPEGLQQIATIGLDRQRGKIRWTLSAKHARVQLDVAPGLRVSSLKTCRESCIAGLGVAKLPEYLCQTAEQRGQLVRLYPDWKLAGTPIFSLHRDTEFLSRNARTFVDFLGSELGR